MWEHKRVRSLVAALAILPAALLLASPAAADEAECNDPNCTPGIAPNIVLGSYCDNATYYAFGVTSLRPSAHWICLNCSSERSWRTFTVAR